MAISEPYELDGVTVSTSEISITNGDTSLQTQTADGIYSLFVDPTNMAAGDVFEVRIYEKVEGTGGTKRLTVAVKLIGAQTENLVMPGLVLINGWEMTIIKLQGTDRAFDASVRKVA